MSTTQTPLVSIVIPVYNVEQYVNQCLESVRRQTYENLELIVVDDCSTDNSLKALEPHLADKRIRLIQHEQNRGLSAARNTGIDAATGEYLMFVDSDDVVERSLVEVCKRAAKRLNADVITYDCLPFNDGEPVHFVEVDVAKLDVSTGKSDSEYFELPHFAWLKFVRAELFKDPELRFPVGLCYEDWPFHWRLGLATPFKYRIDARLYHYRQRGTSITGSTGSKLLDLYRVQVMVIDMVGGGADSFVGRALGKKLLDSYWSILTRIDNYLLGEAYAEARFGAEIILKNGFTPIQSLRRRVVASLLNAPTWVGLPALRGLRVLLSVLSSVKKKLLLADR